MVAAAGDAQWSAFPLGSRVEALYDDVWYPGTVVAASTNTCRNGCWVHCDADEDGVYTLCRQLRLVSAPATSARCAQPGVVKTPAADQGVRPAARAESMASKQVPVPVEVVGEHAAGFSSSTPRALLQEGHGGSCISSSGARVRVRCTPRPSGAVLINSYPAGQALSAGGCWPPRCGGSAAYPVGGAGQLSAGLGWWQPPWATVPSVAPGRPESAPSRYAREQPSTAEQQQFQHQHQRQLESLVPMPPMNRPPTRTHAQTQTETQSQLQPQDKKPQSQPQPQPASPQSLGRRKPQRTPRKPSQQALQEPRSQEPQAKRSRSRSAPADGRELLRQASAESVRTIYGLDPWASAPPIPRTSVAQPNYPIMCEGGGAVSQPIPMSHLRAAEANPVKMARDSRSCSPPRLRPCPVPEPRLDMGAPPPPPHTMWDCDITDLCNRTAHTPASGAGSDAGRSERNYDSRSTLSAGNFRHLPRTAPQGKASSSNNSSRGSGDILCGFGGESYLSAKIDSGTTLTSADLAAAAAAVHSTSTTDVARIRARCEESLMIGCSSPTVSMASCATSPQPHTPPVEQRMLTTPPRPRPPGGRNSTHDDAEVRALVSGTLARAANLLHQTAATRRYLSRDGVQGGSRTDKFGVSGRQLRAGRPLVGGEVVHGSWSVVDPGLPGCGSRRGIEATPLELGDSVHSRDVRSGHEHSAIGRDGISEASDMPKPPSALAEPRVADPLPQRCRSQQDPAVPAANVSYGTSTTYYVDVGSSLEDDRIMSRQRARPSASLSSTTAPDELSAVSSGVYTSTFVLGDESSIACASAGDSGDASSSWDAFVERGRHQKAHSPAKGGCRSASCSGASRRSELFPPPMPATGASAAQAAEGAGKAALTPRKVRQEVTPRRRDQGSRQGSAGRSSLRRVVVQPPTSGIPRGSNGAKE